MGRRPIYRRVVCDREAPDRDLPGPCRQGERIWGSRLSCVDTTVDLLLRADFPAGSRIYPSMGAQSGTGSQAQNRRSPRRAAARELEASFLETSRVTKNPTNNLAKSQFYADRRHRRTCPWCRERSRLGPSPRISGELSRESLRRRLSGGAR